MHTSIPVSEANSARSVLVVDDENGVRDLMSRWLQAGGYSVASAAGADEALGLMETSPSAVALCDVRMPGRDGLWLADRIRQEYPETAVIMATAIHDFDAAISTLRHGVVDCLTKPFGRDRLRDAVVRGIEWHRDARDLRCWRERLEAEVDARHARLARALAALRVDSDHALDAILTILTTGEQDAYTHAQRVAELALGVAQAMGLSDAEIANIRRAALLHDLGKLAMPEALLRKPAALTPEEQAIIRRHTQLGADLVATVPFLKDAAGIVRDAQERPDGLGYPAGLASGDISISAQIVAATDAYDTMIGPRIFRSAMTPSDAFLELDRCSGTQFDPQVVRVLKQILAVH